MDSFLTLLLALASGRPPAGQGQCSPATVPTLPDWVTRKPRPELDRILIEDHRAAVARCHVSLSDLHIQDGSCASAGTSRWRCMAYYCMFLGSMDALNITRAIYGHVSPATSNAVGGRTGPRRESTSPKAVSGSFSRRSCGRRRGGMPGEQGSLQDPGPFRRRDVARRSSTSSPPRTWGGVPGPAEEDAQSEVGVGALIRRTEGREQETRLEAEAGDRG